MMLQFIKFRENYKTVNSTTGAVYEISCLCVFVWLYVCVCACMCGCKCLMNIAALEHLQSVSIYRIYSPTSRFKYKSKCNFWRNSVQTQRLSYKWFLKIDLNEKENQI